MSTTKHTPGPWTIGSSDVQPIGLAICHGLSERKHSTIARFVKRGVDSYTELHANATLISAAPELLAALQRLADAAFARDTTMGDLCTLLAAKANLSDAERSARAAIAKAEGGGA